MASQSRLEIIVKGVPKDGAQSSYEGVLGDCPFCHRVLLTIEEKKVPYVKHYVDLGNKPDWLSSLNPAGTVPVMKDLETGKVLADSGDITNYIEDLYPELPVGHTSDSRNVGEGIFPAYVGYLKSTGKPEEAEKKAALEAALSKIDTDFKDATPFIHGANPGTNDFELAPKLRIITGWDILKEYPQIAAYLGAMEGLPSWQATHYPNDMIVASWAKKLKAFSAM